MCIILITHLLQTRTPNDKIGKLPLFSTLIVVISCLQIGVFEIFVPSLFLLSFLSF